METSIRLSYSYGLYLIILIPELATLVRCFPHANQFLPEQQSKHPLLSKKQDNGNILGEEYKYILGEGNSPLDGPANFYRDYYPLENRAYYGEYPRTQKRDDNQVQRAWGAGGLPFNALYMSNPFKPVSTRSEQVYALPLSSQDQQRTEIIPAPAPHIEELRAYKNPQLPVKQKGSSRRFLTFPQLILSYGWNSSRP